jgi:ABC-type sugar transport system permease subunit
MEIFDLPMRAIQRHIGIHRMAYFFLLPNLLIFGLFSFWPMILNVFISFTSSETTNLTQRPWVGLENYRHLLDCSSYLIPKTCNVAGYSFWTGIWNTLTFAVLQVPLMIVFALITAIVLNRKIRARGFWRAIYFYPVMLSPVVVGIIWTWILKRRGILNTLLKEVAEFRNSLAEIPGIRWVITLVLLLLLFYLALRLWRLKPSTIRYGGIALCIVLVYLITLQDWTQLLETGRYRPINWLVDRRSIWPFFWVIFVYSWAHLGFYMLILLAGLQSIPSNIYEAAEMDGTPKWRVFYRITLPLLMPTMLVVLVLSLIKAFQVFDEVWVLTGGGPGQATKMVIQHIYEIAFTGETKHYGVAAASSILMASVILVLTMIQLWLTKRKSDG